MIVVPLEIPTVPFGQVQGRMVRLWDPFERNPHIAVFGITGSGKSHLIRYGILPLRAYSRTLVIDLKDNRGSAWSGFGQPVTELPRSFFNSSDHYRWHLTVDRRNAQAQLRRVFDQIRDEGHCIVVMDDSRSITEREQIGLGSPVEDLINVGREIGITMIMGAQSSAWAVSALKDQPATLFIGQCGGQDQALALAKIVGYGRELAVVISQIEGRQWLYRDKWEGPAILGLTEAPAA